MLRGTTNLVVRQKPKMQERGQWLECCPWEPKWRRAKLQPGWGFYGGLFPSSFQGGGRRCGAHEECPSHPFMLLNAQGLMDFMYANDVKFSLLDKYIYRKYSVKLMKE